jgi:LysM repeat protein
MSDLISWNGISNNFIYPGQVLKVSAGSSSTSNTTGGSNTSSTGNTTTGNAAATYTVKSGDSVWGISNSKGISMSDLISWNGISNNFIYPGQVLKVSAGSSSTGTSTPSTGTSTGSTTTNTGTTTNTTTSATYTVKSGDSVWGISNSKGISMSDLISWNGISNNFIYPGQVLKVSAGSSSSTTSTVTTPVTNNTTSTTTTPTTNTTTGSVKTITVKSGDSVWKIANSNGISMANLISWNNISNNFIYPGQVLKVSAGSSNATTVTTTNTTTPTTATTGKTVTVKAGESVWGISSAHGITMAQLISWNNIQNNFIYPGETLKIAQ